MKDTLRIEFHRSDRTYRSGEPVRGELIVYSDRGESCGSVHLMRYWRTHGKGNSDSGDRKVMLLREGPLEGVPPYRVPFEFDAPGGPLTYHGTFLNVDHYVEARVDIPGMFDPGLPEEFILEPGAEVDPPHPDLLRVTGTKTSGARGCRVIVGALMVLFGFFTLPFGLILAIPGLFLAVPGLTRWVAGAKIGEVSSVTPDMVVQPGEKVRVQVRLNPKKARTINAATAVLRGREIVISGKGSDRRVHMHEIYSREFTMSGPRKLAAGRKATLEAEIEVPDRPAYTFTSKHNEVTWDVRVSVDIPTWPDWQQEHRVVVWASKPGREAAKGEVEESRAAVGALPPGRERAREKVARRVPTSDTPPPAQARTPAAASAPVRDAPPPATPSEAPDSLASAVEAILERKAFGGGRDPFIRKLLGQRYMFDLEVDLVKHTFGAGPDPTYRHGRTVTGAVAGAGIPVEVRFPATRNEEIDRYRRGAVHAVTATVVDWEKLSEKPVLEA